MNRWQAIWRARTLERRLRAAERREREALARIGRAVHARGPLDERHGAGTLQTALHDSETQLAAWNARLSGSLDADRADYAIASPSMRWLVVARGVLDRSVVRERVRFLGRQEAARRAELGAKVVEWNAPAVLERAAQADLADVAGARADASALRAERDALLAPWGGQALPGWAREVKGFARYLWFELRPKLLPRLPALAGLIAGWWVARQFTDSPWDAALSFFGIGEDRTAVSSETKARLAFWVPLVAAALCAYVGARLGARVHRRYMPSDRPAGSGPVH